MAAPGLLVISAVILHASVGATRQSAVMLRVVVACAGLSCDLKSTCCSSTLIQDDGLRNNFFSDYVLLRFERE